MLKSKTVIGALGAILAAVGGVMSGELEIGSAINVIVTSVLAIFLRHGQEILHHISFKSVLASRHLPHEQEIPLVFSATPSLGLQPECRSMGAATAAATTAATTAAMAGATAMHTEDNAGLGAVGRRMIVSVRHAAHPAVTGPRRPLRRHRRRSSAQGTFVEGTSTSSG